MTKPIARPDPHDAAADLWGRKPRKAATCRGCAREAEPFARGYCFLCVATGRLAPARVDPAKPAPGPAASPVYTAVRLGGAA